MGGSATGGGVAIAEVPFVAKNTVIIGGTTGVKRHWPLAAGGVVFVHYSWRHNLGHRGITRLHLHCGVRGMGLTGAVDRGHGQGIGAQCIIAMPHGHAAQISPNAAKAARTAEGLDDNRLSHGEVINPDATRQIARRNP